MDGTSLREMPPETPFVAAPSVPRRAVEAADRILEISLGLLRSRILHAAAELGIADLLAAGPLPCEALAAQAHTDADALYRLLRALAAMGIFIELDGRAFALNDAARFLLSDVPRSARDLVRYLGADWNVRTLGQLLHSTRSGDPAFDLAHGMPLFDYLRRHEDDARLFDSALARFTAGAASAVIASYDFSRFSRVVDVGGGNGQLLCAMLNENPSLTGVLLDRPDVIESARAGLVASGVANRLQLVAGDFFEAVPPGGDVYMLKNVIHDFDAGNAIRVLSNCRKALPAGGRMLLVESILAGRNEGEFAKLMDVGMLATTGGRERTEREYAELLESAGLRLLRVVPTKSAFSVLEAGF